MRYEGDPRRWPSPLWLDTQPPPSPAIGHTDVSPGVLVHQVRTWAFSVLDGENKLQVAPGLYDERVFLGLDYVLAAAARCNIRVVLVFTVPLPFRRGRGGVGSSSQHQMR